MKPDERYLIQKLTEGDKNAFNAIYYKYVGELMRYCMSYLNSVEDMEEIVSDVFISLWENRSKIRNRDNLKPFLIVSTRNRIMTVLRKKVNSTVYENYLELYQHKVISDGTPHIEYDEFEKIVFRLIGSLPSTQREVIIMSKIDHLSHNEIAEKLGLNIQTVKNALSMGLKTLHEKIKNHFGNFILIFLAFSWYFL